MLEIGQEAEIPFAAKFTQLAAQALACRTQDTLRLLVSPRELKLALRRLPLRGFLPARTHPQYLPHSPHPLVSVGKNWFLGAKGCWQRIVTSQDPALCVRVCL